MPPPPKKQNKKKKTLGAQQPSFLGIQEKGLAIFNHTECIERYSKLSTIRCVTRHKPLVQILSGFHMKPIQSQTFQHPPFEILPFLSFCFALPCLTLSHPKQASVAARLSSHSSNQPAYQSGTTTPTRFSRLFDTFVAFVGE